MPNRNYKPSRDLSKAFVEAVQETPGIRATALAEILNVNESTISVAGRFLSKRGRIVRKRDGRFLGHYIPEAKVIEAPQLFLPNTTLLEAEIEALKAEIEELRAFKECALAAHPDLAIDPLVLKAREIVAEMLPQYREQVLSGGADEGGAMRGAVATLRAIAAQKED